MELGQLGCFVAIVETGTFTAAARRRHLGQSAVSASIAALERELHTRLFERTPAAAVLTSAGHALLPHATAILDAHERARDDVAAAVGRVTGDVRVGIPSTTGRMRLAAVITDLRRTHPGVTVHLLQSTTGSSGHLDALRDGRLDLALVGPAARPPRAVRLETLSTEQLVLLCRPDDPLARHTVVSPAQLQERPYLALPGGWGVRAIVDDALQPTQPPIVEAADYDLLADLAAAGIGIAVVPGHSVRARDDLAMIPTDLTWRLALATASRRATAAAAAVIDALRRHADAGPGGSGRLPAADER